MRVIVRLQYWMKIVQYWLFVHLNYSCVVCILCESCVCGFFLILVLLNVLELSVASILLTKYTSVMGGLGLFSTHELPLCCDHDYYCFCPCHSKIPVGCGFLMLKASWGHLNVLYFNSYSLLIVICWYICDISRYPFSF